MKTCMIPGCVSTEIGVEFVYSLGSDERFDGQACPVHATIVQGSLDEYSIGPFRP